MKNIEVFENGSALFQCHLSKENISVEWYFNGLRINPSESYYIVSHNSLHQLIVSNVNKYDQGQYSINFNKKCLSFAKLDVKGKNKFFFILYFIWIL